jgi:hypothetical protein
LSLVFAFLFLGVAAVLAALGTYALAREDVQGGADAAGGILVAAAVVAAFLGAAVLAFRRRRP